MYAQECITIHLLQRTCIGVDGAMRIIECTPERPWGIHPRVHNDETCPRCGWIAPGPLGDARAVAEAAAAEALARAGELGGAVGEGGCAPGEDVALAA